MKRSTRLYLDSLRKRLDMEYIVWKALHLRYWRAYKHGMENLKRRKP